jgi:hypothetical protein
LHNEEKSKECIAMIRFMSKASASFVMLDATAKEVLKVAGFDWSNQGIWRVERLDEVIQKLQQAHDRSAEQAQSREQAQALADADADGSDVQPPSVGFHKRLYPVLEMLRAAKAANEPVVWDHEG